MLIINNRKEEAFRFINSIEVNNETQLKVIHYNQLLDMYTLMIMSWRPPCI